MFPCTEKETLGEIKTDVRWIKETLKAQAEAKTSLEKDQVKNSVYRKMTWTTFALALAAVVKSFIGGLFTS